MPGSSRNLDFNWVPATVSTRAVGGASGAGGAVAARRCLICINDNESHKTCVVVVRLAVASFFISLLL